MLNNPEMTNSTFVEGYNTNGSLIYPAYLNNPRISHAHGWSTGPVSALSTLVAGIRFVGAAGSTWLFHPQVGNLTLVEAGFPSTLGHFEASYSGSEDGGFQYQFSAPAGTAGNVSVPIPEACAGREGVASLTKVQLSNSTATIPAPGPNAPTPAPSGWGWGQGWGWRRSWSSPKAGPGGGSGSGSAPTISNVPAAATDVAVQGLQGGYNYTLSFQCGGAA